MVVSSPLLSHCLGLTGYINIIFIWCSYMIFLRTRSTFGGLALPDQEGSRFVSRGHQQTLRLPPAQVFKEPSAISNNPTPQKIKRKCFPLNVFVGNAQPRACWDVEITRILQEILISDSCGHFVALLAAHSPFHGQWMSSGHEGTRDEALSSTRQGLGQPPISIPAVGTNVCFFSFFK